MDKLLDLLGLQRSRIIHARPPALGSCLFSEIHMPQGLLSKIPPCLTKLCFFTVTTLRPGLGPVTTHSFIHSFVREIHSRPGSIPGTVEAERNQQCMPRVFKTFAVGLGSSAHRQVINSPRESTVVIKMFSRKRKRNDPVYPDAVREAPRGATT